MVEGAAVDSSLPYECWETIFKFLINNDDNNNHHLRSLSSVSKQFLSITNHLLFSLNVNTNCKPSVYITADPYNINVNINDYNRPSNFLSHLIHRFSNLNSLHLTGNNLNKTLCQISNLPFITLKSLHLNFQLSDFPNSFQKSFPTDGLRLVSRNITTLTSLTFSHIPFLRSTHLFLIAECFPLLEQLNLSSPGGMSPVQQRSLIEGVKALSLSLLKLRKVDLTNHYYIDDQCLCYLFKNWKLLQEAIIIGCDQITNNGLASALCERPTLRSFSFSGSSYFLFYAAKNSIVCPQLMSLTFTSRKLRNRGVGLLFASIFPNLQQLDFSACTDLYEDDICQVLTNCTEIRQLNLAKASRMMLRVMNFHVPKLEVLNLSHTRVDDEALYVISKSCRGLLKLLLENCCHVTEKGVNYVVEHCTQLREINLNGCQEVHASVIASMVLSRPSLRRIIAPQPNYCFSDTEMKLFSRQRCLVEIALPNLKL